MIKIDKVVLGIVSITILEGIALTQGINGVGLSLSIAAISGLCGYTLHDIIIALKRG